MAKDNFCNSPMDLIATPPKGYRGGSGSYDGEEGLPKRTGSPNGVPEKVREGIKPTGQANLVDTPMQPPKKG